VLTEIILNTLKSIEGWHFLRTFERLLITTSIMCGVLVRYGGSWLCGRRRSLLWGSCAFIPFSRGSRTWLINQFAAWFRTLGSHCRVWTYTLLSLCCKLRIGLMWRLLWASVLTLWHLSCLGFIVPCLPLSRVAWLLVHDMRWDHLVTVIVSLVLIGIHLLITFQMEL
jgi:hypothetical protein